jgi:hypothetical protein
VFSGPEAASPPIQQKFTTIWRKLAAISNISKIPLLFSYFWSFHIDFHFKQITSFRFDSTALTCYSR